MTKKWALYIGKLSGIKVYIHWTFLFLIGWIFFMHARMGHGWQAGFWGVVFILALFACVVLHEFGHALTAKRFNIKTRDITIYPIGGIASLESMPDKPGQELLVAFAGPAVNIIIAFLLWIYLQSTGTMPDLATLKSTAFQQNPPFVFNLFAANIALFVFNLIPAFPMDGGRVLRALLAFKMDRTRATRIAAVIGQVLAAVFVFFGIFYNLLLVFIGLFIYFGAGAEASYETTKNLLSGFRVADVLIKKFTTLSPDDSLDKAVQLLLGGQEQEFLVTKNEDVMGILTRKQLIYGLSALGKSASIADVMQKDFLTLSPEMNLQDVYMKMLTNVCNVYPVKENDHLIGIVDKENVSELILVQQATHGKGNI
jgi:Zn-dependent protease/predicted transcriptional regulator